MEKKQLHHLWTQIRSVKIGYLVLLLLVSSIVAAFALRQNNLEMVRLRDAVYQADEQGGDVEGALQRLRAHVYAHMNTDLSGGNSGVYPPIQLKYTYQRLQQAEKDRVNQDSSKVYTDAQAYCERLNPTDFSGRNRVPCIEKYVSERTTPEKVIPDALYKFDFVSPTWSADVAGVSLAIAVLTAIVLALRIAAGRILKSLTR